MEFARVLGEEMSKQNTLSENIKRKRRDWDWENVDIEGVDNVSNVYC